jgi:hypothetical protein
MVMYLAQPSDMLEGCYAHQGVGVASGHRHPPSSPKTMLVVPCQSIGIRALRDIQGGFDLVTVKSVVVSAVLKLLSDAPADLEP